MSAPDIDAIFRIEFNGLVRQLRSRFGDGPPDPEDAVQTAFLRLNRTASHTPVEDPRGFLYTAARNLMLDGKRRSKTHATYLDEKKHHPAQTNVEEITPERVVLAKDRLERMNALITTLPEKQRRVLALSRLSGMTFAEISAETGYSMADISRQLTAALKTLRDSLKEADGHD